MNHENKRNNGHKQRDNFGENNWNEELEPIFQEKVDVPESLLPENVEKRLQELENKGEINRKKTPSYAKYAAMAATLLLVIGVGTSLVVFGDFYGERKDETYEGSQVETEHANMGEETVEAAKEELAAVHYQEAYEVLKTYQSEREIYEEDYVIEDAESDSLWGTVKNKLRDFVGGTSKSTDMSMDATGEMAVNESDASSAGDTVSDYSQTNVRTQGVDEADIVKTDGNCIYEYDSNTEYINIYKAAGEKTKKIGEINLNSYEMEMNQEGIYIQDGILVVTGGSYPDDVSDTYKTRENEYIRTLLFDVTNPEKPQLLHKFFQDGALYSTRLEAGVLYLISQRYMDTKRLEEEREETYIPKVQGKLVPEEDVIVQKNYNGCQYTIISSISLKKQEYVDRKAVLGGTENLYMGSENIYLADTDYYASSDSLQLMRISYKKGKMKKEAQGTAKGYFNDDYSMDEYNGYLRMVTTYYNDRGEQRNGLFILDENLKQVGCLKNLAKNEEIYSARFLGDTAYFVTYRNTDPLFAVDVSNPEKPKMLSYLKIPGFSSYLHPYSKDLLLGIGLETDEYSDVLGLKLSMFDISDPGDVKEVDKVVLREYDYAEVIENPNALFIDTEKNRIGFQVRDEEDACMGDYLVYSYNEKTGFVEELQYSLMEPETAGYGIARGRGVYIGDTFYVVSIGQHIAMFDLQTLEKKKVYDTRNAKIEK